jgi:hypothetical protein
LAQRDLILTHISLRSSTSFHKRLFGNSILDPAMKHEAAHGQIDEGLGDVRLVFVVTVQPVGVAQPLYKLLPGAFW